MRVMKTTEYLYGCTIDTLPSMDAGLRARIEAAEELLRTLLEVSLIDRDWNRIADVVNAISHNNKLLKGII